MISGSEPTVLDDGRVECHNCYQPFDRIGYHWSAGRCPYPELPAIKQSIVDGLMLGDGTLRTHTTHPFVQVYMANRSFLEWLDDELGWLTTGVSEYRSAERSAELSRENGHPDASSANYHDVYSIQTRCLDTFDSYTDWYEDGETKSYPDDIDLTPTMAKVWYACDGSLNWDRRYPNANPHVTIGVSSQIERSELLTDLFAESTCECTPRFDQNVLRFTVEDSRTFLDWIGDAPAGFDYKWAFDSLDEYESTKPS